MPGEYWNKTNHDSVLNLGLTCRIWGWVLKNAENTGAGSGKPYLEGYESFVSWKGGEGTMVGIV